MALPKYFSNLMKSEKAVLASAILEAQKNGIVSTGSCSLDWACGGIVRGAMSLLWGPAGSGKSTLALKLMAEEQKRYPDKYAIWIDTEYSFDAARSASLGVDLDRVILFQSNLMEDAIAPLGKMEQEIIKDQSICFIGLDAIKGLTSINEQAQIGEGNVESAASAYGGIAKSVNPALNLLVRLTYETKCVTVLCNHAMANLDPMTSKYHPYILTGGQKLKHLCSTVIFLNKPSRKDSLISSDLKDGAGHAITVGSTIVAKVNKSRKVVEGRAAEFYWNLQTGEFDKKERELINLAKGLGVLHIPAGRAKMYFGPEKDEVKGSSNEWEAKLAADETLYNKIWDACKNTQVMSAGKSLEVADLIESD